MAKAGTGIFQSTHPRRVRRLIRFTKIFNQYFNPRTREGCDQSGKILLVAIRISIHAPAKGATDLYSNILRPMKFQSTHPRRVRQQPFTFTPSNNEFQSTHPRRVRHRTYYRLLRIARFQSTHPRRVRRQGSDKGREDTRISIHAPAKGATTFRGNTHGRY